MKRFHHVSLSFFSKEAIEPILGALDQLLPFPTARFLEAQWHRDPERDRTRVHELPKERADLVIQAAEGFDDTITVVTIAFRKGAHAETIFDAIMQGLPQADRDALKADALAHLDDEGRFHLRLALPALRGGEFALTTGGDCVKFEFLIAAYPKNPETISAAVQGLF